MLPQTVSSDGSSTVQSAPAPDLSTAATAVTNTTSTTQAYPTLVLSGNPIVYYAMNDTTSTLVDSGPHRLNGAYGTTVKHGGPKLITSNAASATFNGAPAGNTVTSNAAGALANSAYNTASRGLTVEAWIQPNGLNATNNVVPIVSYGRQAQGQAWVLQVNPQSMLMFWMKATGGAASTYSVKGNTTVLQGGQAYHVAATYNGSTVSVYVNGSLEGSAPASGAINYAGITSSYGLGIGGALGGTLPIFNGSISDVSVFPTALSASTIQQHFLTGHISAAAAETPLWSDKFVDTIGVNTHITSTNSAYYTSWSTFQTLLTQSGIRHLHDGLGGPTWYPQRLNALASSGIHTLLGTTLNQSMATISSLIPQYSPSIEAVMAPNEPDLTGGSGWVTKTRTFQQELYSLIKGNASWAHMPVLAPPLTSQANELLLGNLSAYIDNANMHDYFDAFNPGTPGWGSTSIYGTYGSITMNMNVAEIVGGGKPVMATETGYGDGSQNTNRVDDRTLSRYVPRLYLEHYLHGVPRTYIYEFYDEAAGTLVFDDFGLVHTNNTPKPSYTVLKNLIGLLSDKGTPYAPTALSYVTGGNTNHLHHLLLQRRTGQYQLVLWLEVPSFNTTTRADITVPAQSVTIHPNAGATSGSYATFDNNGNMTTTAVSPSSGTFTVAVDDRVSVLTFK